MPHFQLVSEEGMSDYYYYYLRSGAIFFLIGNLSCIIGMNNYKWLNIFGAIISFTGIACIVGDISCFSIKCWDVGLPWILSIFAVLELVLVWCLVFSGLRNTKHLVINGDTGEITIVPLIWPRCKSCIWLQQRTFPRIQNFSALDPDDILQVSTPQYNSSNEYQFDRISHEFNLWGLRNIELPQSKLVLMIHEVNAYRHKFIARKREEEHNRLSKEQSPLLKV
jgi:hypothetical protein